MPTLNELQECQRAAQPPPKLDEAVWQAWLTKGRLREERSTRHRVEVLKAASIVGLLAAAGLWSYIAPYEIAFRFAVAAVCIFVVFHALRSQHYIFGTLFGAFALFYNPILPLFTASGNLQRVLLAIGAILFAASLSWRDVRKLR